MASIGRVVLLWLLLILFRRTAMVLFSILLARALLVMMMMMVCFRAGTLVRRARFLTWGCSRVHGHLTVALGLHRGDHDHLLRGHLLMMIMMVMSRSATRWNFELLDALFPTWLARLRPAIFLLGCLATIARGEVIVTVVGVGLAWGPRVAIWSTRARCVRTVLVMVVLWYRLEQFL